MLILHLNLPQTLCNLKQVLEFHGHCIFMDPAGLELFLIQDLTVF